MNRTKDKEGQNDMATRLADTRMVPSMQEAEQLMTEYRQLTCAKEVIIARGEKRIAAISEKCQEDCAPIDKQLAVIESALGNFILANPELFKSPRQHTTPDGKFGLRESTRLEIDDQDALVEHIFNQGYDDCIEISRKLRKPAIAKRVKDGEAFPGVRLERGDLVTVTVSKALVKEAVDNA